jgi:hypothetical protein
MKKTMQKVIGAGIVAASVLGIARLAGATTPWGPITPTSSQAVTDTNPNNDTVTIQASIFNGAAFATVNSNTGPFTNVLGLECSDGSIQAQQVNGTNQYNGNLSFYCPFFTTAVKATGQITSN